ncbi:hypothetical protein Tco_0463050 [Tanacetum coccineum]
MAPRGRPTRLNQMAYTKHSYTSPMHQQPQLLRGTSSGLNLIRELMLHWLKQKQADVGMATTVMDEGVVGLTRWFEKMESVFSISNCPASSQVKFATYTLQDDALTWWNSHVKTTTPEVDNIEKYIGGLPDMILGSVKASKSETMQEVIEFTTELMEDKTHAYAERQAERKRKYDDLPEQSNQQQQNRRQNTGRL